MLEFIIYAFSICVIGGLVLCFAVGAVAINKGRARGRNP